MNRRKFLQRVAGAGAGTALTGCVTQQSYAPATAPKAAPFSLEEVTLAQLQKGFASGRLTSASVTREYLQRIHALDRRGPRLKSILEINPEAASIAGALDRERIAGKTRGPLHGIPVLIKDNLDTRDHMSTTAGSLALEGSLPPRDSFVVERLRAAGAVILGKTNLSEWANFRGNRSLSGWSGRGGQTRNPYFLDRSPSGSSSGSAAAVSANFAMLAIGTETNGSIVSPASCCGVVGLKPTVGLVSRAGIIPIAASQDSAGPLARTVTDAAALLAAILGPDPRDPATTACAGYMASHTAALLAPKPMPRARLGVARNLFQMHPLVDPVFAKALGALREHGAELIEPIKLPTRSELGGADYQRMLYEFKAGLNAYFATLGPGASIKNIEDVIEFNQRNAARELRLFGQETLIEAAAKGPLTDAAYVEANARCRKYADSLNALMDEHRLDAIIAPTTGPAGTLDFINGDRGLGGSSSYSAVAGWPIITVPCGDVFGLPVGLSFFGRAWSEPTLVNIALAFEQATHARRAPRFLPTLGFPEAGT